MNSKRDFSNTICLIDADGTLFNSLVRYNGAIDKMFLGKYTDQNYIEYYSDFNNAYDIIPGSPWKLILDLMVQFLGYDKLEDDALDKIVEQFEDCSVEEFKKLSYDDFAIKPIFDFCKEYVDNGGKIVIHSGTNRRILEQMLTSADVWDLFSGYLCTDMLECDVSKLGKWGYKAKLLELVKERYNTSGRKAFVLGDTKGDGFGAAEHDLPFVMSWRGYPKDPYKLTGELKGVPTVLRPDVVVDMRQERVDQYGKDEKITAEIKADLNSILDWCETL